MTDVSTEPAVMEETWHPYGTLARNPLGSRMKEMEYNIKISRKAVDSGYVQCFQ